MMIMKTKTLHFSAHRQPRQPLQAQVGKQRRSKLKAFPQLTLRRIGASSSGSSLTPWSIKTILILQLLKSRLR